MAVDASMTFSKNTTTAIGLKNTYQVLTYEYRYNTYTEHRAPSKFVPGVIVVPVEIPS